MFLPASWYCNLVCLAIFTSSFDILSAAADPIPILIPQSAPTHNVVQPNFMGVSMELSFMNGYFGNDTSTIPNPIINYFSAIRSRTGDKPLRLRIGGNSMDSSTYDPNMASPMLKSAPNATNADNQPVTYGPMLFDVMKKVSDNIGGAQYLIGLSLLNLNSTNLPVLAGTASQKLGSALDGYLLGNEPDLYTAHKQRPDIKNYTVQEYIKEFRAVSDRLRTTFAGDLLKLKNIGGPTICCAWDLETLLQSGYLANFSNILKYISLQHYPQNNCFGGHQYEIDYYTKHANVINLAAWQKAGIATVQSNMSTDHPQLIMSEFNSASCGGVPEISDTFAVGSLWTVDYALQMASVGYAAAYLHTREQGITYNLFAPPEAPSGSDGTWTTNPPYYALIATAEALSGSDGSVVVDLNVNNSKTDKNIPIAGYAVYNAKGMSVQRFVLFNYANTSTATATFSLPANSFGDTAGDITIKYLSAKSYNEKVEIAWGGLTLADVKDGLMKNGTLPWMVPNRNMQCSGGCSVDVPPTTMAVVFVAEATNITTGRHSSSNGSTLSSPSLLGIYIIFWSWVLGSISIYLL